MSDTTRTTGPVPGAIAGLVATAAALAAAEALSVLISRPGASPVLAVGDAVVDLTPLPLKQFAVDTFGTADKIALFVVMGAVLAATAAVLGAVAARRRWAGYTGIAVFATVGLAAALTRPDSGALDAVPTLVGALVCAAVLLGLLRTAASGPTEQDGNDSPPQGFDRRRFALVAGAVAAVSAGVGTTARSFAGSGAELSRSDITLPRPAFPAAPVPDGADLEIDGLAPFLTPNEDFYRIDTALSVPHVDATAWSLRIHGLGARERVYTFADLLARDDLTERDITLACVSNPVGGDYVGNARWIGVPLAALLEEAGVRSPQDGGRADQLVSRSEDGMTIGTPVADVMDGRDALLAVGMNGRPLPREHGFPARMVVPGLYGYVSACKWIVDIELTTFDAFDAYWVPRGWSAQGPVKTQSRIDTPRGNSAVGAGTVAVAGVAWAQHTGIDQVEIRVDGGDWQPVTLAAEDTADTWRQWVFDWAAEPGDHELTVRATDRRSRTQTADPAPPAPDGATGHHTIEVTVE
ncbi:molybdopterin-dependent oxidoreductase [Nocardiopsis ganjiahuensis]|uniref:molybdopterin-dependent oxidoreductase n=1 Tax=Nocardiopsis ganjiahuensis TaxID=239984 RepID=UPI0003482308|nr:molybdopterin-dependent oxidoreductase [Nocardiopsis ganjiahuensis]